MHELVSVNKVVKSCEPLVLKANLFQIPLALLHNSLSCIISSVILLNNSFVNELVGFLFGECYVSIIAWIIAMSLSCGFLLL